MNIKKYIRHITQTVLIGGILISSVTACSQFLEMDPPKTELTTPVVFSGNSTANAAILSIYARMAFANGVPSVTIPVRTGLLSDEFVSYSTNEPLMEFYTNAVSLNNANVLGTFWTPYYNIIFQCNAILEGLQNNTNISEAVSRQLTGEARFTRAYFHFHLVNLFGDIPIITSTDYRVNAALPRSSITDVYQSIVSDLLEAKNLLNTDYIGVDGITTTTERVRPNKAAVQALLARVYLYMKDYTNAESESTEVINNSLYNLPNDLNQVFLKNNPEAIWQLQHILTNPTNEAAMFILTGAPTAGVVRMTTVSEPMLFIFEPDDARKENWLDNITVGANTYTYPSKYKVANNNSAEYSTILRLAEQYLIRAEARIHLQNIQGGIDDLNSIRERANVALYNGAAVSDPLTLVELERQRELFAEGHRWFDLIRTNKVDEVMAIATPLKGGNWVSTGRLLPIPPIERERNPNLTQNDGYN